MGRINAFFLGGVIVTATALLLIAVLLLAGRRFLCVLHGAGLLGAVHAYSFAPWGTAINQRIWG